MHTTHRESGGVGTRPVLRTIDTHIGCLVCYSLNTNHQPPSVGARNMNVHSTYSNRNTTVIRLLHRGRETMNEHHWRWVVVAAISAGRVNGNCTQETRLCFYYFFWRLLAGRKGVVGGQSFYWVKWTWCVGRPRWRPFTERETRRRFVVVFLIHLIAP